MCIIFTTMRGVFHLILVSVVCWGQNVGIGTNAPQCRLHVAGTNPMLAVGPYAIGPLEEGRIMATGATAALEFTNRSLGSTWPANPQPGDRYSLYAATGRARLWTDVRGDLVTFTPDGKMGLGLNHIPPANHLPQATLHIHQYYTNLTEPEMRGIAVDYYSNTPWAPQINQRKARGTPNAPSPLLAGDVLAAWWGWGYNGAGFSRQVAMRMLAAENWNTNARGTFIIFETTPIGGIYPAERVRISPEGNVGIGTSSPASSLHVVQVASSSLNPRGITVDNYSGIGNPGVAPQINQRSARGTPATPSAVAQGDGLADFSGGGYDGTNFAQQAHLRMLAAENWTSTARGSHITLETTPTGSINPAERMRITAGGYIGVGLTNPISILHILQIAPPNQNPRGITIDNYSGTGNPGVAPQINQRSARGLPSNPGALLSNDILANYSGGGWYGTDFSQQALIRMYARQDWTASNRGSYITLETTPNNQTNIVRSFVLDHNGFVFFNPPDNTTFPTNPIIVGYNNTNGNGAHVTAGGTWTNGSSRLLKDRREPLDPHAVLQKIRDLPVEGWYYKGTQEYHIGPYAEEFYAAFGTGDRGRPEFSSKYLAASDIAGVALLGTKALLERLERLEAENAALKAQLQELKARLETK